MISTVDLDSIDYHLYSAPELKTIKFSKVAHSKSLTVIRLYTYWTDVKKNKKPMNRNSASTFSSGLATEFTVSRTRSIPQSRSIVPNQHWCLLFKGNM